MSKENIVLDRQEFFSLVRRAALLTSEQSSLVKLAFGAEKLVMTAMTPEVGEARVSMPIKYSGKGLEIAFNPTYLKDVLSNMDEDEITFGLTDSLSPGVIKGEGTFVHVIMPMRLTEAE